MSFNKKDSVADAVHSVLHQEALKGDQKKIDKNKNNKIDSEDLKILRGEKKVSEEIDVKDRTVDTVNGRIKTDKNDDVGPTGNFKSTKVRFHAGPDNKSADEVEGTTTDANKETQNKTKLRMGESTTLKGFKARFEEHSIYDQMIQEVLGKDAAAGDWIHDFVHSDNPKFAGKSKAQRKKMALAAYYAKQRNEDVEQVEENSPFDWKKPREPEVKGGSGVKKGRAYGGAAQKSKPEQEEPKEVKESKRPEDDSVPFAPPYNTTSAPVTDKSGATHTPMSRAKHLAKLAMSRVKKDLGKKGK